MKIGYLIILACLSAIFYRLGGKKGYNTRFRDIGCSLVFLVAFCVFGLKMGFWCAYALVFGLTWGALSTYWDWMSYEGKDSMYLHGAGIGLAAIPLLGCGVSWYAIIGRVIFLALSFGLLNKYVNKWQIKYSDDIEEYMRGFLLVASLPILSI